MKHDNAKKFAEVTTAVMVNFGAIATEALLELWFTLATEDCIPIDHWEKAAAKLIRERRFSKQPTYADFREIIFGPPVVADVVDVANEQVNIVLGQVRNVGSWGTPVFQDPITLRLMTSRWSWKSVCAMTETEHKWWAKEFADAYQSARKTHRRPEIECGQQVRALAERIGK